MTNFVRTEMRDRVVLLTLDDPERRNALSLPMAEELAETLGKLADDPDVGALVLTGKPPAFSAGADLADLARASRERLGRIYAGFLAVAGFPLPTIAAVNGAAVGAGLNLALACDLRIAARSARFESRFLDLALHPGGGHTWMFRNVLGDQGAAAAVLLGAGFDGDEAAKRGLAWSSVEDERLLDEALKMAGRAAAAPRALVERMKATLREMAGVTDHDRAVAVELEAQLWSAEQPEFRARLEALRARISRSGP